MKGVYAYGKMQVLPMLCFLGVWACWPREPYTYGHVAYAYGQQSDFCCVLQEDLPSVGSCVVFL